MDVLSVLLFRLFAKTMIKTKRMLTRHRTIGE